MAPDLEYFLAGQHSRTIGHAAAGQFLFCLPLALALTWVVTRIIAEPLARHLPEGGPFHLRDYALLARKRMDLPFWLRAAASGLLGSFSHIAWDGFTHRSGFAVRNLELLQGRLVLGDLGISTWKALQHGGTLLGGLFVLWLLHQVGERRLLRRWYGEPADPAKQESWFWPALACGAVLSGLLALLLPGIPQPLTSVYDWAEVAFKTVSFSFLCLCAACWAARLRKKPES
jgi:hypothetical protein